MIALAACSSRERFVQLGVLRIVFLWSLVAWCQILGFLSSKIPMGWFQGIVGNIISCQCCHPHLGLGACMVVPPPLLASGGMAGGTAVVGVVVVV